ncbi:hypothetical protein OESDEN_13201, partial [Oesophagostomum dentatum]
MQWDEPLPPALQQEWNVLRNHADGFEKSVPRRSFGLSTRLELAVFADASEIAMSACAYLFNENYSSLVMAKSKLPSIKSHTTMPKMEMNALTIATRLAFSIFTAIQGDHEKCPHTVHIFSDSQIALSWLSTSTAQEKLGVLVNHRLDELQKIKNAFEQKGVTIYFKYVPTDKNPADAGTRGVENRTFESHIWWTGPEFLKKPKDRMGNSFLSIIPTKPTGLRELNYSAVRQQKGQEARAHNIHSSSVSIPQPRNVAEETVNVFHSTDKLMRKDAANVLLLTGMGKVYDKNNDEWVNVEILFDPGAGQSFISRELAERLRLDCIAKENFQMFTFGSHDPRTTACWVTRVDLWDDDGHQHSLRLCTTPILTEKGKRVQLSKQDQDFIKQHNIRLSKKRQDEESNPEILLGCDQLWSILEALSPRYTLPSGLQLIPSKIGYLITGKQQCSGGTLRRESTPTTLSIVRVFTNFEANFDEDLDRWDKYWTIDSAVFKESEVEQKTYGCIFTCMVTRLIHLELVRSMSTEDFLNALRRFIARRGVPRSITCDNAPTFLLGAEILSQGINGTQLCQEVLQYTSHYEIEWHHITPYAPWQGGFYERLIKSVKQSLYKSLRGQPLKSLDRLATILTEIEACLNSRPLTYQESDRDNFCAIRPIDFIQHQLTLTLPYDPSKQPSSDDPDYLTPEEARALSTRRDAEEALKSSCRVVERFWQVWQDHYLTSLREMHKKYISKKRSSQITPTVGDIVLVTDPVLPRNDWRLARIIYVRPGTDGQIREVELITATKRKIRRPVNLLVPLEIASTIEEAKETDAQSHTLKNTQTTLHKSSPYNLRPRKPVNYADDSIAHACTLKTNAFSRKWFLFYITLLSFVAPSMQYASSEIKLSCTDHGAVVQTHINASFEICAENHCTYVQNSASIYPITFPPEITLHDYTVSLKWLTNGRLSVMETVCPSLSFCENIECIFCSTVLFNPECWPVGAILLAALLFYGFIAFIYLLLYVPITIGKPIRIIFRGVIVLAWMFTHLLRCCGRNLLRKMLKTARSRRERISAALAVSLVLVSKSLLQANACQHVNVLEHHSTVCEVSQGKEHCSFTLSEILKINTFSQEACLRLTTNSTLLAIIKIRWKGLYLQCERESLYFTRATEIKMVDSKRCPHMGSCAGDKCAGINTSSLIPELELGNQYPGRTACFESCGGLGCDCFYLSSGCLFYRVYAVPKSASVYEIFQCSRWTETVKLELTVEDFRTKKGKRRYVIAMDPNVPKQLNMFDITMTAVILPPTPTLNDKFITDGTETAVWKESFEPDLVCNSWANAKAAKCVFRDDCKCSAAESKVNCQCPSKNLEELFNQVELKLPVKAPFGELRMTNGSILTAKIPYMVSAEFIVNAAQTIDVESVTLLVTQNKCSVPNSALIGCYRCARGAEAKIRCRSETETLGEIVCERHAFVVPCTPNATESSLRFHFDHARQ